MGLIQTLFPWTQYLQGSHTGSWGTPDVGYTEAIGNIFGSPTTQQGGSNIIHASEPAYDYSQAQSTIDPYAGSQSTGGTGGNTGGGGEVLGTGTSGGGQTDPLSALYSEIDNIYNTTMSYLGGQEQSLRANQPGVEADIQGQYAASQKTAQTEKGIGERSLTEAGVGAGQRKEDALTAGRRLFNELQMGGQQRFGGASSAGQAYGELTGREFQRGQATTQQAYQTAMTKVMDLKANLQDRFDSAMFNLETQKNNALNQIRQTFQEKLSQIDALRAEAGQNKSTMRLDLLSQLRNQVYQINLASVQTQAQLNAQKQNAEQELTAVTNAVTSAQTGAGTATSNLMGATTTNPQTAYAMTTGRQAPAQAYTGQIAPTRRPEDYLYA